MIEPRKDLLQIADLSREEIEHVLADRDPVYLALCDMVFKAVEEPTDATVDRLVSALG